MKKINNSANEILIILVFFGICFDIQVNVVLGQSKPANGSGAMNSSSSQKPKNAISISSESDSDSKIENTSLHQVFF